MNPLCRPLSQADPAVAAAIRAETDRQSEYLQMIASENYTSRAVLEAQGSVMTNKYAEGYPGHRYYGGCRYVDQAEDLARERAKELFGAEYVNVQPHCGSSANMAVYFSCLEQGDTVLAMSLAHGGHLTHGAPVSFSGRFFNFVSYGVLKDKETIDYDQVREAALRHRPKLIVAGASAYPRFIDFKIFREIADQVGAALMVDMAHIAGLVAGQVHPNPCEYADYVTATTHKTLRGPRGGLILARKEYGRALDKSIFPGIQGGPLMHAIAAKAVVFGEGLAPGFKEYASSIVKNAEVLAQGLVKGGVRLVSGGTDTHLILIDVTPLGLTGAKAEAALEAAGMATNKNAIPYDPKPPKVTSGVRVGTAALTTRGFDQEDMSRVAELMVQVLSNPDSEKVRSGVLGAVKGLCDSHPLTMGYAEV